MRHPREAASLAAAAANCANEGIALHRRRRPNGRPWTDLALHRPVDAHQRQGRSDAEPRHEAEAFASRYLAGVDREQQPYAAPHVRRRRAAGSRIADRGRRGRSACATTPSAWRQTAAWRAIVARPSGRASGRRMSNVIGSGSADMLPEGRSCDRADRHYHAMPATTAPRTTLPAYAAHTLALPRLTVLKLHAHDLRRRRGRAAAQDRPDQAARHGSLRGHAQGRPAGRRMPRHAGRRGQARRDDRAARPAGAASSPSTTARCRRR